MSMPRRYLLEHLCMLELKHDGLFDLREQQSATPVCRSCVLSQYQPRSVAHSRTLFLALQPCGEEGECEGRSITSVNCTAKEAQHSCTCSFTSS